MCLSVLEERDRSLKSYREDRKSYILIYWVIGLCYKDKVIENVKEHIENALASLIRIQFYGKTRQIGFHIIM